MERGLFADLALVHAHTGDTEGTWRYRMTARNFKMMAPRRQDDGGAGRASREAGRDRSGHDPQPGIFVKRIVDVGVRDKRIERARRARATMRPGRAAAAARTDRTEGRRTMAWTREQMRRARQGAGGRAST